MIPTNGHGRPDEAGEAVPVRLVAGAVYRFAGLGDSPGVELSGRKREEARRPWAYPPGDYLLLAWGRHAHAHQELVCYAGLGGRDRGEVYFCPLLDWARMFTLRAAPPPPEKAAGVAATGSGV